MEVKIKRFASELPKTVSHNQGRYELVKEVGSNGIYFDTYSKSYRIMHKCKSGKCRNKLVESDEYVYKSIDEALQGIDELN